MLFLTDQEILEKIIFKVKSKRKMLGLSQKDLALKAGLSFRTVQVAEAGGSPNLKSLIAMLRALGELYLLDSLMKEETLSPKERFKKGLKDEG
jgi:transcriptional regulator with XRE-family HTH domain